MSLVIHFLIGFMTPRGSLTWQLFYFGWLWQIAPTEDRGALGSLNQIGINIGILLALVAGLPLADMPSW